MDENEAMLFYKTSKAYIYIYISDHIDMRVSVSTFHRIDYLLVLICWLINQDVWLESLYFTNSLT